MLIIGLIAGALLATAGTALAESVFERVTAIARPDYKVKVDGKDVELQNAPLAYNGTTYVPLREAGEIFGYKVGFKSGTISLDQLEEEKDVDQVEPVAPVETEPVETPGAPVEPVETGSSDKVSARDLVSFLAKKYPDLAEPFPGKIGIDSTGTLMFGEQSFKLDVIDTHYVDITPLVDAGIVDYSDFQ